MERTKSMKIGYILSFLSATILVHGTECPAVFYKAVGTSQVYQANNCSFSALIPSEWYHYEMSKDLREKGSGVVIVSPSELDGVEVKISLGYYENARTYKNSKEYINDQLNECKIKKKPLFTQENFSGRRGKSFTCFSTRKVIEHGWVMPSMDNDADYQIVPPMHTVHIYHRYVVIPEKQGFYSFHYEAPENIHHTYDREFMKILNSLRLMTPYLQQENEK